MPAAPPIDLSTAELWVLAWPKELSPGDFGPGYVSDIAPAAAGSGSLQLGGTPIGAFSLRIEVLADGEPAAGARLRYSSDGGSSWSDTLDMPAAALPLRITTAGGLVSLLDAETGLDVTFIPGATAPSFAAGDVFTATSRPPPRILAEVGSAVDEVLEILGSRWTGELASRSRSIKRFIANIARWNLVCSRGTDWRGPDRETYKTSAEKAVAAVIEMAERARQPKVEETGPRRYAPDVLLGDDRYGIHAAYTGDGCGGGCGVDWARRRGSC